MDDSKEVVFQQLLLDLQDPNATIREEARWELEDIADNRSIEPLIDYYTNFGVQVGNEPNSRKSYRSLIKKRFKTRQKIIKKIYSE